MINKSINIIIAIVLFLILSIVIFFYVFNRQISNVAYVNTNKVLSSYMGMKEVQEKYQKKVQNYQAKLDSMQLAIQTIEEKEKTSPQYGNAYVMKLKSAFDLQKTTWEREVTVDGDKLTQGVLNQINTFIEDYAKEKSYILVMGASNSGTVLYADQSIDITDQVIEGLNKSYKK